MPFDNGVRVEGKGVYMLLWKTSVDALYHWGILIATGEKMGTLFHQTYNREMWHLAVEIKDVTLSQSLLCALKLGAVEDYGGTWMNAIEACIRQTEVKGEFTCRTWALAAVFELADGGFIGMDASWDKISEIETEAKFLAGDASYFDEVKVEASNVSHA
ncbi:hypothetical protein McanMca71_005336 [Microsporum canis]|uniref:Uncharacterized protein n=1 Tax=Arthroderma otae (strain ATCC MYA-4605 / CBS 113480) TaxID=554155 RepID=C5G189_ARTOC|nr:conserved hypothetical protein [Microsporum canis CBS 113480]EEQ28552.1 conserved hypothetical protein [Microsporum canis CBS 113480]